MCPHAGLVSLDGKPLGRKETQREAVNRPGTAPQAGARIKAGRVGLVAAHRSVPARLQHAQSKIAHIWKAFVPRLRSKEDVSALDGDIAAYQMRNELIAVDFL